MCRISAFHDKKCYSLMSRSISKALWAASKRPRTLCDSRQIGPGQLGLGPGPKNIFKTNIHNRIALFLDSWKVDSYQFLKCVYNQHSCFYSDFCTKHLGCWPWGGESTISKMCEQFNFLDSLVLVFDPLRFRNERGVVVDMQISVAPRYPDPPNILYWETSYSQQ